MKKPIFRRENPSYLSKNPIFVGKMASFRLVAALVVPPNPKIGFDDGCGHWGELGKAVISPAPALHCGKSHKENRISKVNLLDADSTVLRVWLGAASGCWWKPPTTCFGFWVLPPPLPIYG